MDDINNEEGNSTITLHTNPWKKYHKNSSNSSQLKSFRMKSSVKKYLKNVSMFVDAPCVKYLYNLVSLLFHLIHPILFYFSILM